MSLKIDNYLGCESNFTQTSQILSSSLTIKLLSEQTKKEIERRQEEERIRMENILSGNPLLTHYSSGGSKVDHKVKRRWDDDVIFKNCAKSEPEKKMNVFINDSLRSEFHKKFMDKYIK